MRNFLATLVATVVGAGLASCDLQPKISSIPDSVGDFISARYPAMLADPNTEPEIYNSAVSDYGVYASPELYGSVGMDEYVNYVAADDYILKSEPEHMAVDVTPMPKPEDKVDVESESVDTVEPGVEHEPVAEPDDVLDVPKYENNELYVPARAAAGYVLVRRGDTLYSIARENNTTIAELARANNLSEPYMIKVGQSLKLKSESAPVAEKPKPEKTSDVKKTEPVKQPVAKAEKTVESKPAEQKVAATPVEQKSVDKPAPEKVKDVRVPLKTVTVARGDTLYSLSRKYEIPVNDLAVMNDLRAPFALSAGQKLRVPDLPEAKPAQVSVASEKKAVTKPVVAKVTAEKPKADSKKTTKQAEKQKPMKKTEAKKQSSKPKQTAKTQQTKSQTQSVPTRSSSKFTWPVRGTILSHYGAKSGGLYNDGINISAAAGTSVVASENGVVAYAGNEVRGMGNLIIIQHADGWMTVYAHLNSMAVRRGSRVSVGQKIGTVGQTGKVSKPQLHFEIRKGTKSYNPTNYLKK